MDEWVKGRTDGKICAFGLTECHFHTQWEENIGFASHKFTQAPVFNFKWNMSAAEVISFDFTVPVRSLTVHLNEH